jgi:hypothetical protein
MLAGVATSSRVVHTDQVYELAGLPLPKQYASWITSSNLQDINRMRSALIEIGLVGKMLATQDLEEDRDCLMRQLTVYANLGPELFYRPLLDHWIDAAIHMLPHKRRLSGSNDSWYGQNLRDSTHHVHTSNAVELSPQYVALDIPKPSSRKKSRLDLSEEELANQRELKEQRELRKWAIRLFNLYEAINSPVAQQVNSCMNPGRAMLEITGSTRYRTLKAYVTLWYRFVTFLERVKHRSWPIGTFDYVDFLHFLSEEPCAASVPESFLMASNFIEKKSGLHSNQMFASDPIVKSVQSRITEQLRGPQGPSKRAPRFPSVLIEALEAMVLDEQETKYLRGVAWLRLVKVWGSLRYSCHSYISPSRLSMFEGELYGTLKKTKTTGPSKRVRELPLHISKQAYVRFGSWLRVGFDLWLTLAPFERDYFLPRSDGSGNRSIRQMATYSDAASAGLQVLSKLRLPGTDQLLLDENWCSFWTEHSERPTLTTALAVLQHSKDERDLVGRWKPEGSDVYLRTYHAIVGRLQSKVAETMRAVDRFEALQEKEIGKAFKDWTRDRLQLSEEESEGMSRVFAEILRRPPVESQSIVVDEDEDSFAQTVQVVSKNPESAEDDSSEDPDPNAWFLSQSRPEEAFLIIHSNKGSRLHRTNGCWSARYRAVKNPHLCQKEPSTTEYNFRCRLCWPVGISSDQNSSQEESSKSESEAHSEPEDILGDANSIADWSVAGQITAPLTTPAGEEFQDLES